MKKINGNMLCKENESAITSSTYNHDGELFSLQYKGNVVFDIENKINMISTTLKEMKEAGFKINHGKKEYTHDKLYYINIAKEIGLEKTIKAMEEEISLEKMGKLSIEIIYLKDLKRMYKKVNR